VRVGSTFNDDASSDLIHTLYQTGFFQNITLAREGDTLIVKVVERPVIGRISVSGNKEIDKEKLDAVLKDLGLVEGRVFDQATLDRVVSGLQSEYYNRGRYNAHVDATVTPEPRDRVSVKITISEGVVARVAQITIIGSHAFSERTLLRQLDISTNPLMSFFTHQNQYARDKLDTSIQALKNYYLDRGYIRIEIVAVQSALTPDRKGITVTLRVKEGECYKVSGIKFVGNTLLPESKMRSLLHIKPGQVFARDDINASIKAMTRAVGDEGYLFVNIDVVPTIDDKTHQVSLAFYVDPGRRVYVRRISFSGNTQTSEDVLRRQVTQQEASLAHLSKIEDGVQNLELLGYLKDAKIQTLPVPGSRDQVDLDYKITEGPPAAATAGVSYGTNGWGFSASINNSNFLGTGRSVGLGVNYNQYVNTYSINYNNPYYTTSGVQRGFNLYSQKFTPGKVNLANYTFDTLGGQVTYIVPISAIHDNMTFGLGYQNLALSIGSYPAIELQNFVNSYGKIFDQLLWNMGWARNRLDRAIFPTHGLNQSLGFQLATPAAGTPLNYYKTNYNARFYQPIVGDFIFTTGTALGYGNGIGATDNIPFFQNYYAGGIGFPGAVRGYANNSLGPLDSNFNPLGGNLQVTGTAAIIFPNPMSESVRTSLFFDAGNVYNTVLNPANSPMSQHSGPVRLAAGLGIDWRIPFMNGVLQIALSDPLNAQPTDKKAFFLFTLGTSF